MSALTSPLAGTAPTPVGSTLQPRSWIGGDWCSSEATFVASSPADGSTLGQVGDATAAHVDEAVEAARAAFARHRRVSTTDRVRWCGSAASAVLGAEEHLARELSREHGKPLVEALAEVRSAAHGFEVAAQAALAEEGTLLNVDDPGKRVLVRRVPRGVWAVLTPWNFPLNIAVEYLGPALASGNAAVWKPSPSVARIAALFREVLLGADFPQELLQLVTTDQLSVAQHLTTHPGVDAVGFTGGSAAGQSIARACWDKHLLLELGGNSAVVVLDDADLDLAAAAIASSAFFNAGQVCSGAGKILVTRARSRELAEAVAAQAGLLRVGDPLDPTTTMGPVHLASGRERVHAMVTDALELGASVVTGQVAERGNYVTPFVVADVPVEARLFTQETFGPVASLTTVADEESLLEAANSGPFGLVSSLFTQSLGRAFRWAEELDAGLTVVNATSNYWELNVPFGGAGGRASGRGRLGGRYAHAEFTQVKTIALDLG